MEDNVGIVLSTVLWYGLDSATDRYLYSNDKQPISTGLVGTANIKHDFSLSFSEHSSKAKMGALTF